ncbi:HTTM domain-containing protein [Ulvibacter antarcticus]|uniref:Vitamin K-dependent gamma-carboxylase-like protein n=1 Tax=Ulvibacter antarcticus TaxID=442714 RepID=A0A3L9YZT9_9FLAO|nr:HTTM domain-containing protein [Ulvibacter antarcticus]RMA66221.1 vitamin K-dependent gamma-carboxylase-like protein [Ulvibacter antarcticus]
MRSSPEILLQVVNKFLFKHIDNTGLVLFRVFFGLLIAIEAFGAIITGWVRLNVVEPEFTFNFIGFDFLQYLIGPGMYAYFAVMGIFGIMVMLGYKYRISMVAYAIMWTAVYLIQKTSYNNHYYLMMLLCWIMAFLPAHRWFSIDAKLNPELKSPSMPRWVLLILILQVWLVYTFASVAKFYPDWLDGTTTALFMKGKSDYSLIGGFLQLEWVHYSIAYVGILFDLLIVPLLLWKRTRLLGFGISVFFHLFNSIVFQIGIFPYMSIAFALFFFSSETLQKRFLPKKKLYTGNEIILPKHKNLLITVFSIYFLFQIGLPLRHWTFKDDVLWTEEGHRLSWRMMLRSKGGMLTIYTEDKATQKRIRYDHSKLLTKKQRRSVKTKPDILWQLAQRIKNLEAEEGRDVSVYMDVRIKINGGKYFQLIDPETDLAAQKWHPFKHSEWILPSPEDYHKKPQPPPRPKSDQ